MTIVRWITGLLCITALARAQEARIITVADAGAPVPGRVTIAGYEGVPPSGGDSSIAELPGWPVSVSADPSFAPFRNVVFADLDGDGPLEIIAASTSKRVWAWDFHGNVVPGFPVAVVGMAQYAPSVGDLDQDGELEIVQTTRGLTSGGRLYVIDRHGQVLPGFPKSFHNDNLMGSATLADLDDDGALEIIVGEWAYPVGYLHVVEWDGSEWGGNWPVALDSVAAASPSVADVDGDGRLEVAYQAYETLYLVDWRGVALPGWPKQIPGVKFSYQSPAFADLDGDGKLEIVFGAHDTKAGCYVLRRDASAYPGWPQLTGTWTYAPPTVADLDGDHQLDILLGRAGTFGSPSNALWAWTSSGSVKPGFPYQASLGGGSESAYAVADIDSDGKQEIFAGYNIVDSSGNGFLFGIDASGHDLAGFPLRPRGFTYLNGATIGDVDGDGTYELGVLSYDGSAMDVNLYALGGRYRPSHIEWETYLEQRARGGCYHGGDRLHLQGDVAIGQQVELVLHDHAGDEAFLWVAIATIKLRDRDLGWYYLNPSPLLIALLKDVPIPPDSEVVLPITIPNDPAFAGVTVYFQGLTGSDLMGHRGAFTNLVGKTMH